MEPELLAVAEVGREAWPELRRQWQAAGLVAAESVPGWDIPFFRFHPGLAPLWAELSPEEQVRLSAVYRRRYYGLANFLYNQDIEHPGQARAMARIELPNLLQAVHAAFAAGEPAARDFGDSVLKLLMNRAEEQLQDAELAEARWMYEEGLTLCRALGDPALEAMAWHQLGLVSQKSQDWPEAERCYQEALRLREANGLIRGLNGAVATWNQLGFLRERVGDASTAESWYRKAIDACRRFETPLELAMVLSNLAGLWAEQTDRLDEAREVAEEALKIKLQLDPGVARIGSTYTILALIAGRQGRLQDAGVLEALRDESLQTYRRAIVSL